jgi:hypothetical protein
MTLEQMVKQALTDWAKFCLPKNLLNEEHNASEITAAVWEYARRKGSVMVDDVVLIVSKLGDMDTGGRLRYHKPTVVQAAPPPPPAPPNPIDNLPHKDVKELAFLRTMNDVLRFQERVAKDGLDFMSGFKYLREGSKPYQELNDRLNYIKQHQIETDPTQPAETKPSSGMVTITIPQPPEIVEARKLVDAMTLADVGATTSTAGRRVLLTNKQKRVHNDINDMRQNGKKPNVILQWVRDEIAKFGSGSVR